MEGLQMVLGKFDSETVLIETQLTQLINQNCSDDSFEIEVRRNWSELRASLERKEVMAHAINLAKTEVQRMADDAKKCLDDERDRLEQEEAEQLLNLLLIEHVGHREQYALEDYEKVAIENTVQTHTRMSGIVKVRSHLLFQICSATYADCIWCVVRSGCRLRQRTSL